MLPRNWPNAATRAMPASRTCIYQHGPVTLRHCRCLGVPVPIPAIDQSDHQTAQQCDHRARPHLGSSTEIRLSAKSLFLRKIGRRWTRCRFWGQGVVIRVEITAVRSRSPRCQELALTTGWDGEGRCGRTAKRPVFRAGDRAPTVTELTRSRANTEASGPKGSAGQPGFGNRAGDADGDRGLPGWPDAGQRRPRAAYGEGRHRRTPATDR